MSKMPTPEIMHRLRVLAYNKNADYVAPPEGFPKNKAELEAADRLKGTLFSYKSKYGGRELELVAEQVRMEHTTGKILEEQEGKELPADWPWPGIDNTILCEVGPVAVSFVTKEGNRYNLREVVSYTLPNGVTKRDERREE